MKDRNNAGRFVASKVDEEEREREERERETMGVDLSHMGPCASGIQAPNTFFVFNYQITDIDGLLAEFGGLS
ncbi:hypothetical protein VN97_g11351 [Penicillium thymicola]|uniref:Uncharacterized protein n=1 Tax=Penicillium thymicola TaxID=293382 RepID=A0AAI9T8C1_PENTH|nr:hypothetical protein VN97_g11351 [Penicillium thymicola]